MTDTATVISVGTQVILVTLPAEIDMANALAIGEELADAAAPGGRAVIADMTATTFCDSMGLRMLVQACRQARADGSELRLLVTSPGIMRVITILGLDVVLPLYQSLEQAIAGPPTYPGAESG